MEDKDCAEAFPDAEVHICGNVYDKAGLDPVDYDDVRNIELIMFGIPGFDNVAQGFLTIFQILTLESWVNLMYNYQDTGTSAISVIFFILIVIFGAFFAMNLVLAVIVEEFNAGAERIKAKKEADEAEAKLMVESKQSENEAAKQDKDIDEEEKKYSPEDADSS